MKKQRFSGWVIALLFLFQWVAAQDPSANFKKHVEILASDEFEGRETGSAGEKKSMDYISAQYAGIGLQLKGENGTWFQEFSFVSGRKYESGNSMLAGKKALELSNEWFPLPLGANGTASGKPLDLGFGISAPDLGHDDYANRKKLDGKIFLIELSSPDGIHPHSKFLQHNDLRTRIVLAEKMGASAVIVINNDPNVESPKENLQAKDVRENIPVVFVWGVEKEVLLKSKITLSVNTTEVRTTGHNVIAFQDNKAPLTVVFGAHYDHLGYGHLHSLYRGGHEPAIHNGADDNASGTAMLIELARKLKETGSKSYNYLFISFSGEELGLYGSKHYADHPVVPMENTSFMINFDMVGRMDTADYKMAINGTGTSPAWAVLDSIRIGKMTVKKSAAGIGPSDQTSFYLKNVPVLHFFSGTHADYHKPSDDADKIYYPGMLDIYTYVLELMKRMDSRGKLAFTSTKNEEGAETPKFSVTLGVVPDYMYDGAGMRIDGVTEGKPAANAGLKGGDIILKLGGNDIKDMKTYMQALSKFKKGDKTIVKIKRGEEEKEIEVTF